MSSSIVPPPERRPECFIIMPISDPEGYEKGHFKRVYEHVFKIAAERAGYRAKRADEVKETNLIHHDILTRLLDSPMAICDLSSRNPNVLFELGLRQAFDKPTVLVREEGTPEIFDIGSIRQITYSRDLRYWDVVSTQQEVADAIRDTKKSFEEGTAINSLVRLLQLTKPAALPEGKGNDTEALLRVVLAKVEDLSRNQPRHPGKLGQRRYDDLSSQMAWSEVQLDRAEILLNTGNPKEAFRTAAPVRESLMEPYSRRSELEDPVLRKLLTAVAMRAIEVHERARTAAELQSV